MSSVKEETPDGYQGLSNFNCSHCETKMNIKDLKQCSRCKLALYCSKECQLKDWYDYHKQICILFKKI